MAETAKQEPIFKTLPSVAKGDSAPSPVPTINPVPGTAETPKRGRGRPKGSKNKPKVPETAAEAKTPEKPKAKTKTKAKPKAKPKAKVAKPKPKTKAKPKAKSKAKVTKAKPKAKSKAKVTKAKPKAKGAVSPLIQRAKTRLSALEAQKKALDREAKQIESYVQKLEKLASEEPAGL